MLAESGLMLKGQAACVRFLAAAVFKLCVAVAVLHATGRFCAADLIISSPSQWNYLDTLGFNQAYPIDAQQNVWSSPSFNVATSSSGGWKTGPSPFAQGIIDGFFNRSPTILNPTSPAHLTDLFRTSFSLDAIQASAVSGTVSVLCDDGCVGYLNGAELFRVNLNTEQPITANTPAVNVNDEAVYRNIPLTIAPGQLHVGENMLAVEVHNVSFTNGDMGLDLNLSLDVQRVPEPATVSLIAVAAAAFSTIAARRAIAVMRTSR